MFILPPEKELIRYDLIKNVDSQKIPDNVNHLCISGSNLITITKFPISLKYLVIKCPIELLVELPEGLIALVIEGKHHTKIGKLPSTLEYLGCSDTSITLLPDLPDKLNHLKCKGSMLISLPTLPNKFKKLEVSDNKLTSLPRLPDSLTYISVENNQLTCLPPLPKDAVIYLLNNPMETLPSSKNEVGDLSYILENPKMMKILSNKYPNLSSIIGVCKLRKYFNTKHLCENVMDYVDEVNERMG